MTAPVAPQQAQPIPQPAAPLPPGPRATSLADQSPSGGAVVAANPMAPPMPPIEVVRGKEYPTENAKPGMRLAYIKQLLRETEPEYFARAKQMAYHLLLANGKQHLAFSNRSRRYEELPLAPNETRCTLNHIRPILRARTNRLLPKEFDYACIPDSNDYDARDQATVAERWLSRMRERVGVNALIDTSLELAYCGGVSFLKSFWNPTIGDPRPAQLMFTEQQEQPILDERGAPLAYEDGSPVLDPETGQPPTQVVPVNVLRYVDGDGNPVPDDDPSKAYWYRPGDTDACTRTLFEVRWNGDAKGFTPGEGLRWVIDHEPVPVKVARERYPEYAHLIQPSGDASNALQYARLATMAAVRTPDKSGSAATQTGEQYTTVTEYWELPSDYFPAGRLIVLVGEIEVGDGGFPDNVFPYEPIFDEPVPGTPGGRGCVLDMVGPQMILNEAFASIVAAMRMQGLGQYVTVNAPGMLDIVTSQMGGIIKIPKSALQGRSVRDMFMPLEHPAIPSDRSEIIAMCRDTLNNVGAFHEVTRGQVPPGVDSGVAVRELGAREDGQLQRSRSALERAMVGIARTQGMIAKARYAKGDERWMPVDRPDLGYQIESVTGEKLPDFGRLLITVSGFAPRSESERRADIKEAMAMGWLTPAQGLKALDLGRGMESAFASEQRHYAKARTENVQIEKGEVQSVPIPDPRDPTGETPMLDPETGEPMMQCIGPDGMPLLLPDIDDDVLHMGILEELILDTTKPAEIRRIALAHWIEHKQSISPTLVTPESSAGNPADPNTPPAPSGGGAPPLG